MGPTLITAPNLLEDLWRVAGRDLHTDLDLIELSPFYRILFQDGQSFDYWGKAAQDEAEIARFEPRDVAGYRSFLAETKYIYERAFVDLAGQPFLSLGSMLRVTPELLRVGAQRSVYAFASRHFHNPYLRMVFSFHPLFIGGNPFRASAIYSIVPYLERLGGVYFARGGMYTLVEALEKLFCSLGGELRCGTPVEEIVLKDRRAVGVRLQPGRGHCGRASVYPARFRLRVAQPPGSRVLDRANSDAIRLFPPTQSFWRYWWVVSCWSGNPSRRRHPRCAPLC
jgi:phytoene desaturase